ncbi:MAG: F0F1 ATP synthase subunit epsilon [Neisseriaceae bacterium]|nr:MAG: F0F1 ATP synthase subunit epsilon [Neisseriaceae bacterium]
MSSTMQVEVVSNEEQIYSGEASFVVVPTRSGELGIYPKHAPIMSLLKPGLLRLVVPDQSEEVRISVSGGVLEVQPDNIKILSDIAVRSEALDEKRAEESKRIAEEKLKNASSDQEREKAEIALEMAIAELKALDYIKTHK